MTCNMLIAINIKDRILYFWRTVRFDVSKSTPNSTVKYLHVPTKRPGFLAFVLFMGKKYKHMKDLCSFVKYNCEYCFFFQEI